ncbi:hypothetical protein D3C76_1433890 [compost metagenome]
MPKKIIKIGMMAKGFSFSHIRRKGRRNRSKPLKKVPSKKPSGTATAKDRAKPNPTRPRLTPICLKRVSETAEW